MSNLVQVGALWLPPQLAQWEPHVTQASQAHALPESLIHGVLSRESEGGTAPGMRDLCGDWTARKGHWLTTAGVKSVDVLPDGWRPPRDKEGNVLPPPYAIPEDGLGWGRGLMQLDYLNALKVDWRDPLDNIDEGARILAGCIEQFPRNLRAGVASYNCGAANVRKALLLGHDEDYFTTPSKPGHPGDYGADVLARRARFLKPPEHL